MRCKKHFADHSSTVGICATCLRDRLISLINSQQSHHTHTHTHLTDPDPDPNPPPLVFPRSVSPYISRRKSDHPIHQRFYSTPLVGPTTTTSAQKKPRKFGLIAKLFRSRSDKLGPTTTTTTTSTSSLSYQHSFTNTKGMSPDHRYEEFSESPARSLPRPSPGRVKPSPARSHVAGIAFCLSPLVRPRHWGSVSAADVAYSGEIIGGGGSTSSNSKPHLSAAASFCANRSRKLADFGRLNRHR